MEKNSLKFLTKLHSMPSPSGFEENASKIWRQYTQAFSDKVWGDFHGNSYANLNEKGKVAIILSGHIDEIGLMISAITKDGYLRFYTIGGWDPQVAVGQRVLIHTKKGDIFGIIGKKPIHLLKAEEMQKPTRIDEMWIDIGTSDKKEAEKIVEIGDPVTIDMGINKLRGTKYVARGFDDRIGAFTVAEALRILSIEKKKLKHSVTAVATVQEEVGLRGAVTSSYNVHPKIGFAVDVGFSSDYPGILPDLFGEIKLGKGPIISRGPNFNPKLFSLVIETAKKNKIPHQIIGAPRGTGTDANAIQLNRGGVATSLIAIPNRYMHTPVEVVDLKDVENAALLIAKVILEIKTADQFII